MIALPFGLATGLLLARGTFRGKVVLDGIISIPLVLPPVTIGYTLLILLGQEGPIGRIFMLIGWRPIFSWGAAAIAACIVGFPLMVRSMETGIVGVDQKLERVARTLGARPWKIFFSITLPLAFRGITAGVLLSFARGLGEFGATIVVAGNIPGKTQTLPLAIFTNMQLGQDIEAIRFMGFSIALAMIALILHHAIARKTSR